MRRTSVSNEEEFQEGKNLYINSIRVIIMRQRMRVRLV